MQTYLTSKRLISAPARLIQGLLIFVLLAVGLNIHSVRSLASPTATATLAPTSASEAVNSPDIAAAKVPQGPPCDSMLERLGQSFVAKEFKDWVALLGVVLAFLGYRWTSNQWRKNFLTEKWTALMEFLQEKPQYMNPEKNRDYKTKFQDHEANAYEIVARLCIGYLDDMYFLGYRKHFKTWFRGSIKLFAGTHRVWLENNHDSYDEEFYDFLMKQLGPDHNVQPQQAKPNDHA